MKRWIVIVGLALVLISGLNSCAIEAYPGGYYGYGYAHPYWGRPWGWHGGYYHGHGGYRGHGGHGYGHGGGYRGHGR